MESGIFSVRIASGPGLVIEIGPLVIILCAVLLLLLFIPRFRKYFRKWNVVEANLSIGGIGDVKLQPNDEDRKTAQQVWVELVTRKAGLPFDAENDTIVEVYNSWFELFKEMRELAKDCPPPSRPGKSTDLIQLLVDVLNKGLRPHLTKWQARFRRWYDHAAQQYPEMSPQEIQRLFPQYHELVLDLRSVNEGLLEYMGVLKRIAYE